MVSISLFHKIKAPTKNYGQNLLGYLGNFLSLQNSPSNDIFIPICSVQFKGLKRCKPQLMATEEFSLLNPHVNPDTQVMTFIFKTVLYIVYLNNVFLPLYRVNIPIQQIPKIYARNFLLLVL